MHLPPTPTPTSHYQFYVDGVDAEESEIQVYPFQTRMADPNRILQHGRAREFLWGSTDR